jgi:hypothetical protein
MFPNETVTDVPACTPWIAICVRFRHCDRNSEIDRANSSQTRVQRFSTTIGVGSCSR